MPISKRINDHLDLLGDLVSKLRRTQELPGLESHLVYLEEKITNLRRANFYGSSADTEEIVYQGVVGWEQLLREKMRIERAEQKRDLAKQEKWRVK